MGLTVFEISKVLEASLKKIDNNMEEFKDDFPTATSNKNVYGKRKNGSCWTESFWTGIVWLSYEMVGKRTYYNYAKQHTESFRNRVEFDMGLNHHDIGFLYTLSCVADYKLTGSERAKETALLAADKLIKRYQDKGKFIQAWGDLKDHKYYRLIIDCYMNLPLLFWASEVTGNSKYFDVAKEHAYTAASVLIREDYSTFHTYYFDPLTGMPEKGATHQGFRDDSCWSRGQAWGIYGMALSYKYLKDEYFIDIYLKLVDYYLKHLPEDLIPYWDLYFREGTEERDTSAAAIAICGMLEMSQYLTNEVAKEQVKKAKEMFRILVTKYSTFNHNEANGLLYHGVYNKPENYGVDEMTLWGDYFFMEALIRVIKDWNSYW